MPNEEIKKAVEACEYYSALFQLMKCSFKSEKEELNSSQIEVLDKIKMHLDKARQDLYSIIERQSYKYYYHGA
jgi:hypothetical protein